MLPNNLICVAFSNLLFNGYEISKKFSFFIPISECEKTKNKLLRVTNTQQNNFVNLRMQIAQNGFFFLEHEILTNIINIIRQLFFAGESHQVGKTAVP
jgi:hypothetical protein